MSGTPPDLKAAAEATRQATLPAKSKGVYEKTYEEFVEWCRSKTVPDGHYTANVLTAYFKDESTKKAPSTLWCIFSKLKGTLLAHHNINIDNYAQVGAFLKARSKEYKPKKSKAFTLDEVHTFVRTADDSVYLGMKVIMMLGVIGALRAGEVYNMRVQDVIDAGTELHVTIPQSKTGKRELVVTKHADAQVDAVSLFRRYLALRPPVTKLNEAKVPVGDALWLRYEKGKCTVQRIGENTIAAIPSRVATFLKLAEPEKYTGHAFRRTGASALANHGADMLTLKQLGGWKSDSVAQGYVEDSTHGKRKRADMVQGISEVKSVRLDVGASAGMPIFNVTGCTNVNIVYNADLPKKEVWQKE